MYKFLPVLGILIAVYTFWRICKFIRFYGGNPRKKLWLAVTALLTVMVLVFCTNIWSFRAVFMLHLLGLFLACDVVFWVIKKIIHKKTETKAFRFLSKAVQCGLVPVLVLGVLFGYGYYNMKQIRNTEYTVTTDKTSRDYEIVLVSDVHYDTIQSRQLVKAAAARISEGNPDMVVLAGDICEEGTSREAMEEVFQVFGGVQSAHGTYYVYGNHDRQPYRSHRAYTSEELEAAIEKGGVHILQDSYAEINDDLVLVGRDDAGWANSAGRINARKLLQDIDKDRYVVVLDHQPIEAQELGTLGADLELSGHTHAGQVWPVGMLSELFGTLNYGEYDKNGCKVIVSSGMAGWGYPIRTSGHCEYVTIHLKSGEAPL